jgi:hypothetical protein
MFKTQYEKPYLLMYFKSNLIHLQVKNIRITDTNFAVWLYTFTQELLWTMFIFH